MNNNTKYFIREHKYDIAFAAILVYLVLITVVAYLWTIIEGQVHTAWEVIWFSFIAFFATLLLALVVFGIIEGIIFVKKSFHRYHGKHEGKRRTHSLSQYVGKHEVTTRAL